MFDRASSADLPQPTTTPTGERPTGLPTTAAAWVSPAQVIKLASLDSRSQTQTVGRRLTAAERDLIAQLDSEAGKTRILAAEGGWVYGSVQDLVLHLGTWFAAATHLHPDSTYSGPATQARSNPDTIYAEGYYLAHGQAHLGAWCATTVGEIHYGPAADAYLGVAMLETFRRAITIRTGSAGVYISQPKDNYQLLRTGMPPGAILDAGHKHPTIGT